MWNSHMFQAVLCCVCLSILSCVCEQRHARASFDMPHKERKLLCLLWSSKVVNSRIEYNSSLSNFVCHESWLMKKGMASRTNAVILFLFDVYSNVFHVWINGAFWFRLNWIIVHSKWCLLLYYNASVDNQ